MILRRCGLLARKIGMTRRWLADGSQVPVTLLDMKGCQVVASRSETETGLVSLQLGLGEVRQSRLNKPLRGHFARNNVEPKRRLIEFRVPKEVDVAVGEEFSAEHFRPGQRVDVTGVTIGKGFAGAMKRWNFRGLRASHGVSITHRSHGSTGNRQDPGRVFKNKKMAGHLGSEQVTTLNLQVIECDADQGILMIKGAIPGHKGGYVFVRDAVKRPLPEDVVLPAGLRSQRAQEPGKPSEPPEITGLEQSSQAGESS